MKSVLISIQPKWCELIASGKKTVEVRKTRPKLETPFKCYIYCTQGGDNLYSVNGAVQKPNEIHLDLKQNSVVDELNGKVIGEFVCDRISVIDAKNLHDYCQGCEAAFIDDLSPCDYSLEKIPEIGLSSYELSTYIRDKDGYQWHISDLVIYDKPKLLSDFLRCNYPWDCCVCDYWDSVCFTCDKPRRPPLSWCYVDGSDTE